MLTSNNVFYNPSSKNSNGPNDKPGAILKEDGLRHRHALYSANRGTMGIMLDATTGRT